MAVPVQTVEENTQRRSLSPRSIDIAALVLIALQVAYFAWSTSTTWFKQDDYAELLLASRAGGFPGTLFHEFNGHLIPAVLALVSAVHWLFGMNWSAVVAVTAAMQLAASFLTWRALRGLLGARLLTFFLFAVYVGSVLIFQTLMWWCTITIYLPLQIAFPAALLLLQRAIRTKSKFDAALPALAVLIGSLFFEKCLTITPFLILLVAATRLTPTSGSKARDRLREAKVPLIILTATTLIYAVIYQLVTRTSPYRPQFEASRLSDFTLDPFFRVFLPSFSGGPFPVGRIAAPGPGMFDLTGSAQMWLTAIFVIGLVAWSLARFRNVLRYWVIIAGFFLVNLAMVVLSGREWTLNPRYYAELVFPTILLVGLAIGGGLFSDTPRRRPQGVRTIQFSMFPRVALTAVASIAVLAIAVNNMNGMRKLLEPAPALAYSETALRSSEQIGHPVTLIRQYVSSSIINGIFLHDLNFTYVVLQPMAGPWKFADAAIDPYMALEDGTVVPAGTSHETVPQYENGLCNIDLHDGVPKLLTMNGDPFPWTWYGSLTAATRSDVQITVDWNADPTTFTIPNGVSNTLFYIPGGGKTMTVTATGGDVCVTDLGFGNLVRDPFR